MGSAIYLLVLLVAALAVPVDLAALATRELVAVVGAFVAWRGAAFGITWLRALIYRRSWFRRRRQALDVGERAKVPQLFLVITSYGIAGDITRRVFAAALAEIVRYRQPAVIVAALAERADERLVKRLFLASTPPDWVRLLMVSAGPAGKRRALALALRSVARQRALPGAAVVLIDGDTILPSGCFDACLSFLFTMPDLAGLTTDAMRILPRAGTALTAWQRLREARRHQLACSQAWSHRLTALDGGLAAYPSWVATDPSLIDAIREDSMPHWRVGRIPLRTGASQSIAYWLLARGLQTLYLPDVQITALAPPATLGFWRATSRVLREDLVDRLRIARRMRALGPGRLGLVPWLGLVEQRLALWAGLAAPLAACGMTLATANPDYFLIYLGWLVGSRVVAAWLLALPRGDRPGLWPILMIHDQIRGGLRATRWLFWPGRQRDGWQQGGLAALSLQALALGVLLLGVAVMSHAVAPRDQGGAGTRF